MDKHWLFAVGSAGLLLTACGQAPDAAGGQATASDFTGCMVTDSGGIEDRSFNASAWAGLQQAGKELGVGTNVVSSKSESELEPNIQSLVSEDCQLIVTVGYTMAQATATTAKRFPDERFAIVDENPDPELSNIKPLLFNTAEASYLAGYLAAGMTTTGTVATFGGGRQPAVNVFMDGFADGIDRYNQDNDAKVKLIGWNKKKQDGTFSGSFDAPTDGANIARNFIQQGADIIMPVAAGTGTGAAAEAKDSGKAKIIWVDADGFESIPQWKSVILTSVMKNISTAVFETVKQTKDGAFDSTPFVGTLANNGVGLAPFHDFAEQVPAELQAKLDVIKEEIVSGTVKVESKNSPSA